MNKINYRPDIDGLRALAILFVILFHAFPKKFTGGFVGVDVFFVLSGYLITRILLHNLLKGQFSISEFYRRRVRRLFPALGLVCLVCIAVGWFALFSDEYMRLAEQVAAGTTFFSNILLWQQSGYFDQAAETKPLLHLWSLAVEEQFYIVWPLLLAFAWRRGWSIAKTIAFAGLASFFANGALLVMGNASADFYAPWARVWELAAGGMVATQGGASISVRWRNLQSMTGLFLFAGSVAFLDGRLLFPGGWALAPVIGTCLILKAGAGAWLNRAVLSHPAMVGLGLISYPLYLWHWPLLVFARLLLGAPLSGWALAVTLLVSLGLAWLTFHFIERNIRHATHRATVPALVLGFVALGYMSVLVYLEDGYPSRPIRQQALLMDEVAWSDARRSDGSCLRLLSQTDQDSIVCRSNTAMPRVMFAGDSHAMALYSGTMEQPIGTGAMLVAWHSCPLYPNLQYMPAHGASDQKLCPDMARRALEMAMALPSVEEVVLVNYAYDVDETESDYSLNDKFLTRAEAFLHGTEYIVQKLLQAGKKPVLLLDVPHLRLEPNACVSRFSVFPDRPGCKLSLQEHERTRQNYRAAVSVLAGRNPGLAVYDPALLLCEGSDCKYRIGQQALYSDTHHLSPFGATRLLHRMQVDGILH